MSPPARSHVTMSHEWWRKFQSHLTAFPTLLFRQLAAAPPLTPKGIDWEGSLRCECGLAGEAEKHSLTGNQTRAAVVSARNPNH